MSEKAILFDSSRCSACKGCQVACKCWNNLPSPLEKDCQSFTGSYQSPVDLNGITRLLITFNEEAGGKNGVQWAFGRRSCMHCTDAGCIEICPNGAVYKDEESGFVRFDADKCTGCSYCSIACPFDVPQYNELTGTVKMSKCDACFSRLEQGRVPACVQTCPPGALKFGDRDEMISIAQERVEYLKGKGFDKAVVYGENELGGLHVIYVAKYGLDPYGLPADPKISGLVDFMQLLKPITGIAVGAVVAGLGLSFLTGLGYKREDKVLEDVEGETVDKDESSSVGKEA